MSEWCAVCGMVRDRELCSACGDDDEEGSGMDELSGAEERDHDARLDAAGEYVPPSPRITPRGVNDYTVTVRFHEDGTYRVQAQGDPYPLGIYNESGFDLGRLLAEAHGAIVEWRNAHA